MPRINRFTILLLIGFIARGQSLLYQEDFQNQNGKGAVGLGSGFTSTDLSNVNWSLDISQCQLTASSDWLQVLNNRLEARDIDGEGVWYSPVLNLQANLVYGFALHASEQGTLESSDYLITEYSLNSGPWTIASNNGYLVDDFSNLEVSHFGLVGSSVQLRVRFKNNADSEYLRIDDLKVEGFQELVFQNGQWNRVPDNQSALIDARIKSGSSVHLNEDAHIKKLIVETNATLEIDSSITLQVDTDLQNDGLLIIASNAALLQNQATNSNTGNGLTRVIRNYYCPDHLRFSFWSSPVQNALIENVFASSNPLDRYEFQGQNQSFSSYTTGLLVPGLAYATTPTIQVNSSSSGFYDTKVFEGELNNGNITVGHSGIQGGDWLLVGNPYPCPIDFSAFQAANPDILNAIHYWDASTNSINGSGYAVWNNAGTVPVPFSNRGTPSNMIPANQGFMVQVNPTYGQSTINLSFDNSMRRGLNQNHPPFFKADLEPTLVWLSLGDSVARKNTLVVLREGASSGFDEDWDANLTFNNPSDLSLHTLSKDSVALAIQSQSFLQPNEQRVIPLEMVNGVLSNTWLAIDSVSGAQGIDLSIYDRNIKSEILNGLGTVKITGLSASIENRYELRLSRHDHYSLLGEEESKVFKTVKLHFHKGDWKLRLPGDEAIQFIALTDLSGRILFQRNYQEAEDSFSIGAQSLPNGIILINWKGAKGSQGTRRFFNQHH